MRRSVYLVVLFAIGAVFSPAEAFHDCVLQKPPGPILSYRCPTREYVVPAALAKIDLSRLQREVTGVPGAYREVARRTAERRGLDPRLVEAIIEVESAWNPHAVSRKGARGLMQLMPKTASRLGVTDPFDPHQNIDGGVRHLHELLDEFRGDLRLVLAAYNAGAEAVYAYRGIPPYPETQAYVRRVLLLYRR